MRRVGGLKLLLPPQSVDFKIAERRDPKTEEKLSTLSSNDQIWKFSFVSKLTSTKPVEVLQQ